MATFKVPDGPDKYTSVQEYFRGVDLNNSPSNVDPSRSPAAPNMATSLPTVKLAAWRWTLSWFSWYPAR